MSGVILLAVSIRHSFIFVTFTSARGWVECDMVTWTMGVLAQWL